MLITSLVSVVRINAKNINNPLMTVSQSHAFSYDYSFNNSYVCFKDYNLINGFCCESKVRK